MTKNNFYIESVDWPILLASGSPRRKEILEKLGLEFRIQASSVDELTDGNPEEIAIKNAWLKATDIAKDNKDYIVIGSDTVVAMNGKIYGKPKDSQHAFEMLKELNGAQHEVISGVAVVGINAGVEFVFSDSTRVQMKKSQDEAIWKYIHSAKPFDKAGAYGIQDPEQDIIKNYDGSFDNVVGFPTELFVEKWNQFVNSSSK